MSALIVVVQNGKLFCFLSCKSFPKRKLFFGFKDFEFTVISNFSFAKLSKKCQYRVCHHCIFLGISRNLMSRFLHIIQPSHECNLTKNWYSSTYVRRWYWPSSYRRHKHVNALWTQLCTSWISEQKRRIKLQFLIFAINILSICWYFHRKGLPLQMKKKQKHAEACDDTLLYI